MNAALRALCTLLLLTFLAKVPEGVYLQEVSVHDPMVHLEEAVVYPSDTYVLVPSSMRRYVERFEREYEERVDPSFNIRSLSMTFVDEFKGKSARKVIGLCHWGQVPRVSILRSWWDDAPELSREALIFHELGHCVLNEQHRADRRLFGRPTSLMNPTVLSPDFYGPDRNYYIRELFEHGRPTQPSLVPDSDCGGALAP